MEILRDDVRLLAGETSTRNKTELCPPAVERLNGGTTKSLASQRVENEIRLQEKQQLSCSCRSPRETDRVVQLKKNDGDLSIEKRTLQLSDFGSLGWKRFCDVGNHGWRCQRVESEIHCDEHNGQLTLFAVRVNVGDTHLTSIELGLALLSTTLDQRVDGEQIREEKSVWNTVEEDQLVDAMEEVQMGAYETFSTFGRLISVIEDGKRGREENDRADDQHVDGITSRLGGAKAFGEERR